MKRFCTLVSVLVRLTLVTLTFLPNSFAQGAAPENMVRLVYFLPSDRPARPERVTALRELIRDTQEYFADQMEHHGFGRKTFNIETDANGTPVVHRMNGKFNENYYNKHDQKNPEEQIWKEIVEHFDDFQHIYFIAIDVSTEALGRGEGACGLGGAHYFTFQDAYGFVPFAPGGLALRHRDFTEGEEVLGGSAIIPASGYCFEDNRGFLHPLRATTHELAHAFGLGHDFSDPDSAVGGRGFRFSQCEVEWLSVSRFFNTAPIPSNETGKIELLSVQAYNKDVINLRFKVTDPDGLHQAQLLVPEIYEGTGTGPDRLFDCKRLNGKMQIIESAVRTSELVDRVLLQIVDVNGNITWATLPIQLDAVPRTRNAFDVNNDGGVNIADLKGISSRLGQRGKNPADINEDKVVNINDLLLVAASLSSASQSAIKTFTTADVQKWLTDAEKIGIENEYQRKGVVFLQHLLTELGGEVVGNIATNRTVVKVPTTGTNLAVDKPPELARDNFAVGPGEFTILVHNGQRAVVKQAHFKIYDAYSGIGNNSRDIPNLSQFFQDGGRIELISLSYDHAQFGDIVISEIMWGLDGTSPAKQYIELYNASAHTYTFADADLSLRFSTASQESLPDGSFPPPHNPDVRLKVLDRVSNKGWKVPGKSGNTSENKPLISMYRAIDYTIADVPDGTLASSWKASTGRVNLPAPSFGTPGAKHLPPAPVVAVEASQRPPMYWIDAAAGTLHRLIGDTVENLLPNVQNATSLAVDIVGGKLYWTEKTGNRTGRIRGANLDGINVKLVKDLTSVAHGIGLDAANGKLYLTNGWGKVQRLDLDGSNFQSNLITNLNAPRHIALDVADGKVYWTETAAQSGRIQRANLDGSSVQNVATGLMAPLSLAVASGKVYWTSARKLQRANLDGTNSEVLETLPIAPTSIAVDPVPNSLYLTLPSGEIHRRNLDGSGDQPVVTSLGTPSNIVLGISATDPVPTDTPAPPAEPAGDTTADVNQDKKVNKTDLLLVVTALGESPPANPNFDVNADGTVNIADVLLVIEALDDPVTAAAPSFGETLTALDPGRLAMQIDILRAESDGSMKYEHAIALFQSLLASIHPTETQLLANYPNPFNPETWIPYQLAAPTDVSVSIYSADGRLIRTLDLGQQPVGVYASRSRAAYWDGRNALDEPVASGVYFYTLTAGDFTATRRMLILK